MAFSAQPRSDICFFDRRIGRRCDSCKARRLSFCAHVDDDGMDRLQALTSIKRFARNDIIYEQGSPLDGIYIVAEGMIKLFQLLPDGRRQITGFLGPGDLLGGIKRGPNAHCTAQALGDVITCYFQRSMFLSFLKQYPDLTFTLLITATDEIEAQYDHIVLLGRQHLQERLAAFLLIMSHRWHPEGDAATTVHLPMTRSDIADYLGLTVESVSRGFTKFRELGFVDIPSPRLVELKNVPALYHLAGFHESLTRNATLGL